MELIAVRGEELCLAYNVLNNGPDERRSVVLIRSDGEVGLSVDYYDEDQLGEALDELDRQWVDLGGPTQIVDVWRRFRHVMANFDPDALRECLSEDFVDVDHRRVGMGERNVDEYVKSAPGDVSGERFGVWVRQFERWSEDSALARVRRVSESTDYQWDLWEVSTYRDGRLCRNEAFPIDAYGDAAARYRQVVIEFAASP